MYWLRQCPVDDQGLVAAMALVDGRLVMKCDVCNTVWCVPDEIDSTPDIPNGIVPRPPDYKVRGDSSLLPGFGDADFDDLERFGWLDFDWQDYEPPLTDAPLFFVIPSANAIAEEIRKWLASVEAEQYLPRTARPQVEFFVQDFDRTSINDFGHVDFRHHTEPTEYVDPQTPTFRLTEAGQAIRFALDTAHAAVGRPPKAWGDIP